MEQTDKPRRSGERSNRTRVGRILEVLESSYRSPWHNNKTDPFDELVFILLSQMTTSKSFNRVFDHLKHTIGDWERLLVIRRSRLAGIIKNAGLSIQKSERLKLIAKRLKSDFGAVTLQPLAMMSDDEAENYLTSLPGVGLKTAKCILMYSLGRDVLPVDTHVGRVGSRLGLVTGKPLEITTQRALEKAIPIGFRYSFHVNAMQHGISICQAKTPHCGSCPLARLCPEGRLLRRIQQETVTGADILLDGDVTVSRRTAAARQGRPASTSRPGHDRSKGQSAS